MDEFRDLAAKQPEHANGVPPRTIQFEAELLDDIGYQLRNQLNGVRGAAGLLSQSAESSEERELADIVESAAEQVARIVDAVLDYATIASGEFELALHPFDVRGTVESCLALVSEAAGAKSLDISFNAAPE